MTDTSSSGNSAEAGIGNDGNVLAEIQVLERGGKLIRLLHACSHRSAADHYDNVARMNLIALDGSNCGRFAGEDARTPELAIDAVRIDYARVDRRAFDHRPKRRKIAMREANCRCEPALMRGLGVH